MFIPQSICNSMRLICENDFGGNVFFNQLNAWRGKELSGVPIDKKSDWASLKLEQQNVVTERLFLDWLHYKIRLSVPHPRYVIISEWVKNKMPDHPVIKDIISCLENGNPLSHRVSRQVLRQSIQEGKGIKKLKNDSLMWHWGIHHFHLGNYNENTEQCEGTDLVLLCYIEAAKAVLIDILPHGQWIELPVLKKLQKTSPDILDRCEIRGAVGLARHVSPAKRRLLMHKNINSPIKIGNKVYMGPGVGTVSSGHSLNIVRFLDTLVDKCNEYLECFTLLENNYPKLIMKYKEPHLQVYDEVNGESFGCNLAHCHF